jgi:hypothetical protein
MKAIEMMNYVLLTLLFSMAGAWSAFAAAAFLRLDREQKHLIDVSLRLVMLGQVLAFTAALIAAAAIRWL